MNKYLTLQFTLFIYPKNSFPTLPLQDLFQGYFKSSINIKKYGLKITSEDTIFSKETKKSRHVLLDGLC